MTLTLTIHRGTHQIGGCVTEIRGGGARVFIDMGSELPGEDGVAPVETMSIPGVTAPGPPCHGVFFTHTHSDHMGQIDRIVDGVPLYLGETAKELALILNRRLSASGIDKSRTIARLEQANTFAMSKPINIKNITITPYWIDHSAFDAYMFLIEAEGKLILHTGDFRLHGFIGSKTLPMLEKYVKQVDWLVCEGALLSRDQKEARSERELQDEAKELMRQHKRVFVLCSSMNIHRIAGLIKARPDDRPVVCDPYQKDILAYVERLHGSKTPLYQFGKLWSVKNNVLHDLIEEQGCLAFIRPNDWSRKLLDWFDDGLIIYSMWDGYLDRATGNPRLVKMVENRNWEPLHTSGHATRQALRQVCETVDPRRGLIPIHSAKPEEFLELFPDRKVKLLKDGETLEL